MKALDWEEQEKCLLRGTNEQIGANEGAEVRRTTAGKTDGQWVQTVKIRPTRTGKRIPEPYHTSRHSRQVDRPQQSASGVWLRVPFESHLLPQPGPWKTCYCCTLLQGYYR